MSTAEEAGAAAWRVPGFRRFILGRFTTVVGTQSLSVVAGWQIYALTNDPMALGWVGLFQFLPHLLLFPVTGMAADRFSRKGILMIGNSGLALVALGLAALSASGNTAVAPIYGLLCLLSVCRAFLGPASQGTLPLIVPPEVYSNAMTWGSTIFSVATIAGPAIGGGVYATTQSAVAAYLTAACCFASTVVALWGVRLRAQPPRAVEGGPIDEIVGGMRFIFRNPIILGAITLDLFAVMLGGAVALLPIYARDILEGGPERLGLLRAAPSVGAVGMALLLTRFPIKRRAGPILLLAVAGFGFATIGFGLSTTLLPALISLFLIGVTDEISVFIRLNLVGLNTPEYLRGRVSAAEYVFISVSNEIGQLESGALAAWVGPVAAVVYGGVGSVIVAVLAALLVPALRAADALRAPEAETPG
jgi:MFS family permease